MYAFNGFSGNTNRWTYAFAFVVSVAVAYTLPKLFCLQKLERKKIGILVCIYVILELSIYMFSGQKPEYSYVL